MTEQQNIYDRKHINTKSKLAELQAKIKSFELTLQEESEQKRNTEDKRLTAIVDNLANFEKSLNSEIQRRLETFKTIQQEFSESLTNLELNVSKLLENKENQIATAIETLHFRFDEITSQIDKTRNLNDSKVDMLSTNLQKATNSFSKTKLAIEKELDQRRDKENMLLNKINELQNELNTRLHQEESVRIKNFECIEKSLKSIINNHVALDLTFQKKLAIELQSLKNSLQTEVENRERADDDIIQVLNQYTGALQNAFKAINTN